MNTVSIELGSTSNRRIATIAVAPQSIRQQPFFEVTMKQVWKRPPLPNASPQPSTRTLTWSILCSVMGDCEPKIPDPRRDRCEPLHKIGFLGAAGERTAAAARPNAGGGGGGGGARG